MTDLGHKHYKYYGVQKYMFPIIKHCLIDTLTEFLGEKVMTRKVTECWEEVIDALTEDMLTSYPEPNAV